MFWRRLEQASLAQGQEELRSFLAERLRVAIEFATLGAYELLAQEEEERERPASRSDPTPPRPSAPRCGWTPHTPRPHVARSKVPCARAEDDQAEVPCGWQARQAHDGFASHRRLERGREHRRAGATAPSRQPCTWAGR